MGRKRRWRERSRSGRGRSAYPARFSCFKGAIHGFFQRLIESDILKTKNKKKKTDVRSSSGVISLGIESHMTHDMSPVAPPTYRKKTRPGALASTLASCWI